MAATSTWMPLAIAAAGVAVVVVSAVSTHYSTKYYLVTLRTGRTVGVPARSASEALERAAIYHDPPVAVVRSDSIPLNVT